MVHIDQAVWLLPGSAQSISVFTKALEDVTGQENLTTQTSQRKSQHLGSPQWLLSLCAASAERLSILHASASVLCQSPQQRPHAEEVGLFLKGLRGHHGSSQTAGQRQGIDPLLRL